MATAPADPRRQFLMRSPEGFSVAFEVAPLMDRALAFLIDFSLVTVATGLLWLLAILLALTFSDGRLMLALALLLHFVLRQGYFLISEGRRGGTTFGKRRMGLRVLSRDGGPLTVEAVVARNLMRDLETFLPLVALLAPQALVPAAPAWGRLLSTLWLMVFAVLPLASSERLRCGDLVAGTLVAKAPRPRLLADLTRPSPHRRPPATATQPAGFTREQLDIYGIQELQVLETILRQTHEGTVDGEVLEQIATRIRRKIGWPEARAKEPALPFLEAFYRAQRGRLEQQMVLGQRRERAAGRADTEET